MNLNRKPKQTHGQRTKGWVPRGSGGGRDEVGGWG